MRIFGITAYMLIRSPRLGMCALSMAPVIATVNKCYGNWLSENARQVQNAMAQANSVAQEAFSGIRTVISFASESWTWENYVEKVNRQYKLDVRQVRNTSRLERCNVIIGFIDQLTLLVGLSGRHI